MASVNVRLGHKYISTMDLIIEDISYRYAGRDIIVVLIDGHRQPFYKSTGRNSGQPDTWFPFDGIKNPGTRFEWFDKTQYCQDEDYLRYGNKELNDISDRLSSMNLPEAIEETNPFVIDDWLGYKDFSVEVFREEFKKSVDN